jgi:hypothetical protein
LPSISLAIQPVRDVGPERSDCRGNFSGYAQYIKAGKVNSDGYGKDLICATPFDPAAFGISAVDLCLHKIKR